MNSQPEQASFIGLAIYPMRALGYILASLSVILANGGIDQVSNASWVAIVVFLVWPHTAFIHYRRRGSRREAEFKNLLVDMALIGLLTNLVKFKPAVFLPYLVANSATNHSVRGLKLVLKGLVAYMLGLLVSTILLGTEVSKAMAGAELVPAFAYLLLATHGIGGMAYLRGKKLIDAVKRLKNSDMAKTEFLANMSHELRTPLNSIIGFSDILAGRDLSQEARNDLTKVRSSSRALLRLTDDLITLSPEEPTSQTTQRVSFRLAEIFDFVRRGAESRANEKELELRLRLDPTIPDALLGDPVRLGRVFMNLVDNGIKFTSSGRVSLSAECLAIDPDLCRVRFVVEDTGEGIAPEKIDLIFQTFNQADTTATRTHGGLGLGLTLANQWVELLGGDLTVQSVLGTGSSFAFELEIEREPAIQSDHILSNLKVLVVDDNEANRLVAEGILEGASAVVECVASGTEAVSAATRGHYDFVLMDLHMPEMDGLTATRAIHNVDGMENLPVIALTADTTLQGLDACLEAGMLDRITKPVDHRTLLSTLNRWRLRLTDPTVPPLEESPLPEDKSLLQNLVTGGVPKGSPNELALRIRLVNGLLLALLGLTAVYLPLYLFSGMLLMALTTAGLATGVLTSMALMNAGWHYPGRLLSVSAGMLGCTLYSIILGPDANYQLMLFNGVCLPPLVFTKSEFRTRWILTVISVSTWFALEAGIFSRFARASLSGGFLELLHTNAGVVTMFFLFAAVALISAENHKAEERMQDALCNLTSEDEDRKKIGRKLRVATEAAEASELSKTRFLATMSHQIRTPMNAIIGLAELSLAQGISDKLMDYLSRIRSSSLALLALLDEVIDFSRIESREISLKKVPFSLAEVTEHIDNLFGETARSKGLKFFVEIDPCLPGRFQGDSLRLGQVLANLIGNAVKFTTHGSVTLAITQTAKNEELHRIQFEVKDTGIGIPYHHQDSLFDSFSQVHASTSRNYGGSGLGLTISQSLVNKMGGQISVASEPGYGSTFRFNLELLAAERSGDEIVSGDDHHPVEPKKGWGNISVLLVEDNRSNQMVVEGILGQLGARTTTADHGAQACKLVLEQDFDLVLMDIHMPEMDGYEAARRLRELGFEKPIVALTADVLGASLESVVEAGMVQVLNKPLDTAEFLDTICRVVDGEFHAPEPQESISEATQESKVASSVSKKTIWTRLIEFGIMDDCDPTVLKFLRIVNGVLAISVILLPIRTPFFLALGMKKLALINALIVTLIVGFHLVVGLPNHRRGTLVPEGFRVTVLCLIFAGIAIMGVLAGPESLAHLPLLLCTTIPACVFPYKAQPYRILILFYSVALFVLVESRIYGAYQMALPSQDVLWALRFDSGLFTLCLLVFTLNLLVRENEEAEDRLKTANEELRERIRMRQEAERTLLATKARAENARSAKSDFLANMSHEIRTPMNAISGLARLSEKEEQPSQVADFTQEISNSSKRLLQVINDILDYSKLEAKKIELEELDFEMTSLVDSILESYRDDFRSKGLEFTTNVVSDGRSTFRGDPHRLRQIISHLVENSLKFTQVGGAELTAEVTQSGTRFSVKDSGVGLGDSKQALFERFTQGDTSTTRTVEGSGLGLAICAGLVNLMGGRLEADNNPGGGSVIFFEIFLEQGSEAKSTLIKPPSQLRILVADDNETNQLLARELLVDEGFEVTTVGDGTEVLQMVQDQSFDFVLLDLNMPKMGGIETAEKLLADPKTSHIPLLAFSAETDPKVKKKCLTAGMKAYINKPIDLTELLSALSLWSEHQSEKNTVEKSGSGAFPRYLPGLVIEEVLNRIGGRESSLRQVLLSFYHNFVERQGEMRALCDLDDKSEARQFAHQLKGVAANISAKRLQEVSSRLEIRLKEGEFTESLLHEFEQALEELLLGLSQLAQDSQEEPLSDPVSLESMQDSLHELHGLLSARSFRAKKLFLQLEEQLGAPDCLKKVAQAVAGLKFDDARLELEKLLREHRLEVPLGSD